MGVPNLSLRPGLPPGFKPHRLSSMLDSQLLLSTKQAQVEATLILICVINTHDLPIRLACCG
jgi:hypothetical protein